jgi:hypothetical protein
MIAIVIGDRETYYLVRKPSTKFALDSEPRNLMRQAALRVQEVFQRNGSTRSSFFVVCSSRIDRPPENDRLSYFCFAMILSLIFA